MTGRSLSAKMLDTLRQCVPMLATLAVIAAAAPDNPKWNRSHATEQAAVSVV